MTDCRLDGEAANAALPTVVSAANATQTNEQRKAKKEKQSKL